MENNFLKNLWYLLVKPSFLPYEYLQGRRKKYMAPISLFLLINLVYFIVSPLTDLNLSLKDQLRQDQHRSISNYLAQKRIEKRGINMEEYATSYNNQSTTLSKTLIILHVPVMAVFLFFLYWRKYYYFTDHMIFVLYLIGFILLLTIINLGITKILQILTITDGAFFFNFSGYLLLALLPIYIFFSLKNFYQQNFWWTLLKTPGVILIFIITHFIYRSLLFFIVFWTT